MKMQSTSRAWLRQMAAIVIVTGILICADARDARANVITVNFDALNALGAPITGAPLTSYLAGFGISLTTTGSGASVEIADDRDIYGGGVIGATTGHNLLLEGGGFPVSETFTFANPLLSFQFDRVSSITFNSFPLWSATAYDPSNLVLSTVGEPVMFGSFPARTFVLTGPDIARVTFTANDFGFLGFANEPIDTLVLTAVPEPASLALLGVGLAGLGFSRRRKQ